MLLWQPKEITKGASTGGTRSVKSLGQKRPHAEVEAVPGMDNFEEFLGRANFALTSKDTDKVIVNLTAHKQASSLKTDCLPEVNLSVLLSSFTFKLAREEDIHKLHTGKKWMLEFRSVSEDETWQYNPKFRVNVVVVLYEQLSGVTQKFLNANDEFGRTDGQYWSLDPKDTFGLPTPASMKHGVFCVEKDRQCMQFVSTRLNKTTPEGHSAHGLVAASETIGAVPMSIFRNQIRFPPPGFVYVVGFELPSSAKVKRALASEQDCMLCSDTYTTRTNRGMLTPCGHYMCQTCWTDPGYKKGIKAMKECGICRQPFALAPAPEPASVRFAAGRWERFGEGGEPVPDSSSGVVGMQFRPYGVGGSAYAQPAVPLLEYRASLKELLPCNGFADNGVPEMFIRVLGIKQTEELQFFTADDIREKFSGEIVDKFVRLYHQVVEHYRDEYHRQAQAPEDPPFRFDKVLRSLLNANGLAEMAEVILCTLDIGWTDQFQYFTEDHIKERFPGELGEKLLRLQKLVLEHLEHNIVISDDEEDWSEGDMDFP